MPKKFNQAEAGERGWFVGAFPSSVFKTDLFEACYKHIPAGTKDTPHYHKQATEINLVTRGRVLIDNEIYTAGMGLIVYPNESVTVEYLEDTEILCIKTPSVANDKYFYDN